MLEADEKLKVNVFVDAAASCATVRLYTPAVANDELAMDEFATAVLPAATVLFR